MNDLPPPPPPPPPGAGRGQQRNDKPSRRSDRPDRNNDQSQPQDGDTEGAGGRGGLPRWTIWILIGV
ncbi:MAG: hypothetical protein AAGF73_16000, partial [Actinomycetota bacterium]